MGEFKSINGKWIPVQKVETPQEVVIPDEVEVQAPPPKEEVKEETARREPRRRIKPIIEE